MKTSDNRHDRMHISRIRTFRHDRSFYLWPLLGSLVFCGAQPAPALSYTKSVRFEECWFVKGLDWPETVCGILTVPENYTIEGGRSIDLPFVLLKASKPRKDTVPLVVAGGGGPGGPLGIGEDDSDSIDRSVWISWVSSTIDAGRDLILVDNRGVGSAVPRLDCVEVENAAMSLLNTKLERDELKALIRKAYSECKQRLLEGGIDLRQYHVINAAEDLERLRIGLGYHRINVYGASYGSRIALEYERRYPDSVRSMILDSIFPQSIKTYEDEPRRNYEAVKRVIDKCNRDKHCRRLYGHDLDKRLTDYLAQLDDKPVKLTVFSPVDDKPVKVKVTPQMFFLSLYIALYDADLIRLIPAYLNAIFEGDRQLLADMVREYYVNEISVHSIDEGAYASYACFDEIPFVDFTAARRELTKYPFQHYANELVFDHMEVMCEVWNVPAASAEFVHTYRIKTPLLIYSGELDPVTPAEMARPVIENARRWWAAVWPDVSHHVMAYSECADRTAAVFLRDPESAPFVLPCAANTYRPVLTKPEGRRFR